MHYFFYQKCLSTFATSMKIKEAFSNLKTKQIKENYELVKNYVY